jgi:SAM-dependent methyltransferase
MAHVDPPEHADSLTHVHLGSCLVSEIKRASSSVNADPIRILDAGCGNGRLVAYLEARLARELPQARFEVFGYDVVDHGVQSEGFLETTKVQLRATWPEIDWNYRIRAIGVNDPWPFDSSYFDFVVSNQVLEHVCDHSTFFRECFRVMRRGGVSVHLFPLKHYVYEGHLFLPWVHRIRSHDLRRAYIRALSALGLGKFRSIHRATQMPLDEYAERHADYMAFWTNYLAESEVLDLARAEGLRACFRYTREFYMQKLRSVFRFAAQSSYSNSSRAVGDAIAVKFLRYLSSVSLFLEKENTYRS